MGIKTSVVGAGCLTGSNLNLEHDLKLLECDFENLRPQKLSKAASNFGLVPRMKQKRLNAVSLTEVEAIGFKIRFYDHAIKPN